MTRKATTGRIAYRLDTVRTSGCVGWYGGPDDNPKRDDPTGKYRKAASKYLYTPRATCLWTHTTHDAPDKDCECGWRAVQDPNELHPDAAGDAGTLGTWAWKGDKQTPAGVGPDGRTIDLIPDRGAIVEVLPIGRHFPIDDTATSIAAERLKRVHVHVLVDRTDREGMDNALRVRKFYGRDNVTMHHNIEDCLAVINRWRGTSDRVRQLAGQTGRGD
jgi:hypothetical protein